MVSHTLTRLRISLRRMRQASRSRRRGLGRVGITARPLFVVLLPQPPPPPDPKREHTDANADATQGAGHSCPHNGSVPARSHVTRGVPHRVCSIAARRPVFPSTAIPATSATSATRAATSTATGAARASAKRRRWVGRWRVWRHKHLGLALHLETDACGELSQVHAAQLGGETSRCLARGAREAQHKEERGKSRALHSHTGGVDCEQHGHAFLHTQLDLECERLEG
mmetsp:Transcript_19327/g.61267  ORF Transcript_19327/g.61267 Transcript_19327/m.61267 type:complete len:226 (+) Transcript_19327:1093-1770(+)